jgi:AcrR family transcriptional regulator
MFEAAIRILENEELGAFTTNRIAAVAGVSIGTLYQYFPDRDALLVALVKREIDATFERLAALKAAAERAPPADASGTGDIVHAPAPGHALDARIRGAVHIMVNALGGRLHARRRLLLALARSGHAAVLDDEILRHGLAFMAPADTEGGASAFDLPKLDFMQAFVLARAVSGTLRAALLHDANLLQDPRFEDALCALIRGYLVQHDAGA